MHKWNKEKLEQAVNKSLCISDVLKKLLLNVSSGNYKTFYKYIYKWNINISHFDSYRVRAQALQKTAKPLEEILKRNSTYSSCYLKKRLIRNQILRYECYICKIQKWQGTKLSLQLDHINGDKFDNRLENLRLLCPNCHSQTSTYAGKSLKKRYKCTNCGESRKTKQSKLCRKCATSVNRNLQPKTKINWPPTKKLIKMVEESNYSAIGRQLGVSDNAIRKRIKNESKRTKSSHSNNSNQLKKI